MHIERGTREETSATETMEMAENHENASEDTKFPTFSFPLPKINVLTEILYTINEKINGATILSKLYCDI